MGRNGGQWDATAQVTYPPSGKGPGVRLLDQNVELKAVIRGSFNVAIKNMLFEDAYPEYKCRISFARSALLAASRERGQSAAGIKMRLKSVNDGGFAEALANLVSETVPHVVPTCD